MTRFSVLFLFIAGFQLNVYSQELKNDSIALTVKTGVDSKELMDFFFFKNIAYLNIQIHGEQIQGKNFILFAHEYWNGILKHTDTVADLSKSFMPLSLGDSLNISVLSERTEHDSLRINFNFRGLFSTTNKYQLTNSEMYTTMDLSKGLVQKVPMGEGFPLLVHTLPYENPEYPGYLFYCQLTQDGTPPKDWGKKFNIEHYIVFEMLIF